MSVSVAYDHSIGDSAGVGGIFARPISRITRVMDIATIISDAGGTGLASASKITANEAVTAFTLPLGFLVLGATVYVDVAGTGTIDVGVPAQETYLISGGSIATAAAWLTSTTENYSMAINSGTMITSAASDADNVVVQFNSDNTAGRFVIAVWGVDFSDMAYL